MQHVPISLQPLEATAQIMLTVNNWLGGTNQLERWLFRESGAQVIAVGFSPCISSLQKGYTDATNLRAVVSLT